MHEFCHLGNAIPHSVVGGGFNTLVLDGGIDGVVLALRRIRDLELREDGRIRASCGVSHASLTRLCIEEGRSGLEFGAGIPGTVGGWVAMNAGTREREVQAEHIREKVENLLQKIQMETRPQKTSKTQMILQRPQS